VMRELCPRCKKGLLTKNSDGDLSCINCGNVKYETGPLADAKPDGLRPIDAARNLEAWMKQGEALAEELEKRAAQHQAEAKKVRRMLNRKLVPIHRGGPIWTPEARAAQAERLRATNARRRQEKANVGP